MGDGACKPVALEPRAYCDGAFMGEAGAGVNCRAALAAWLRIGRGGAGERAATLRTFTVAMQNLCRRET